MSQMCGAFAQFERSMIVSRVNAGLKRARANGKILSRPKIAAEFGVGILNGPADQSGDGDGVSLGAPQRRPGELAAHSRRSW